MAEKHLVRAVAERLSKPEDIRYLLERVEVEVRKLHAHVPEEIRTKKAALGAEDSRVSNFIAFIGEGKGTRALGQALEDAERKVEELTKDLDVLETSAGALFEAPPIEWIESRLANLREVLERETPKSALILRQVLEPVRLLPTKPDVGRPYYRAETSLGVLELLKPSDAGSNSLRWWGGGNRFARVSN